MPTASARKMCSLESNIGCSRNARWMTRERITLHNNDWLNSLVESKEYSSKSEIINDLIRKARESAKEVEFIRMKLALAEKSGFTNESAAEILAESKRRMNG